jgi:hypothetical protein
VDASADRTYEYQADGQAVEDYRLRSGNNDPRGAASDASGQRVWVIDNDDYVYVYDNAGTALGYWKANDLSTPEGIASDGTDLWIVDRGKDRVYRFAGGANRTSASASATSSFALNSGNKEAKGIETDGTHLWVVNDTSTNKVFKYTLSGTLVGSWTISGNNTTPTGITLDPSNPSDVWIVDAGRDQVFQYSAAANRTSGSQSPSAVFNLASGNGNPQGIADPPAPLAQAASSTVPAVQISSLRPSPGMADLGIFDGGKRASDASAAGSSERASQTTAVRPTSSATSAANRTVPGRTLWDDTAGNTGEPNHDRASFAAWDTVFAEMAGWDDIADADWPIEGRFACP